MLIFISILRLGGVVFLVLQMGHMLPFFKIMDSILFLRFRASSSQAYSKSIFPERTSLFDLEWSVS